MELRSSSHAKHEIPYHFIWCPKYRRFALKVNIGKYVARVIYEVTELYDFSVIALAVMPDHVHMYVSVLPDVSPAHLTQVGGKEHYCQENIRRFFWDQAYSVRRCLMGATVFRDELRHRHHRRDDTYIYK